MYDTDVLIVGAGPSGLTLAASLVSRGISTTVVDRQVAGANTSRAAVVNARTLEVLDDLDVARRLPTAYPYSLMVPQSTTERLLLDRLVELGEPAEPRSYRRGVRCAVPAAGPIPRG